MHAISAKKVKLSTEQIKPYLSPYFVDGFRQEEVAVDEIEIDGWRVRGRCRMAQTYISPYDGLFHLSFLNATHMLVSVGLAHAFVLQDHSEKNLETLLTDFDITCSRAIREETVPVEMNIFARRVTSPTEQRHHARTFYRWRYTLGTGGVWWGNIGLAFPFGEPA